MFSFEVCKVSSFCRTDQIYIFRKAMKRGICRLSNFENRTTTGRAIAILMTEIMIEKRYGAGQESWRWLYSILLNNVRFECRHCFQRNNTASYWMMRSSFRVLIGWFCDPTWGGGALAPLPPRRAASSLVYFTTTRWPNGFHFYLNSSPPTNKTQTKKAL